MDGNEVLAWAVARGVAAGSFNTYNVETTRAIIDAAEAERAPIFLAVGRGALDYAGFELLSALCGAAAAAARVPVALHLDHATDVDLVQRAVAAGFSSVMVDGS
ncbi:MAG: class II fructose-bisphosphate aldolase, partial [Acidimicrobiales bacterium]